MIDPQQFLTDSPMADDTCLHQNFIFIQILAFMARIVAAKKTVEAQHH